MVTLLCALVFWRAGILTDFIEDTGIAVSSVIAILYDTGTWLTLAFFQRCWEVPLMFMKWHLPVQNSSSFSSSLFSEEESVDTSANKAKVKITVGLGFLGHGWIYWTLIWLGVYISIFMLSYCLKKGTWCKSNFISQSDVAY